MADFVGDISVAPDFFIAEADDRAGDISVAPDFFIAEADDRAGDVLVGPAMFIATPETGISISLYLQRLWDTGLSAYVYFTRESTDPTTPALAVGDTQPSNTGAFDFANHALLAKVQ